MSKRKLNRRQTWRAEKIQQERLDRAKKREDKVDHGSLGDAQSGRVISHFGVQLDVEAGDGEIHRCRMRQNLPSLVTGDNVLWRADEDHGGGIIEALEERISVLSRPDRHGQLKLVASNIDQIILVIAPLPTPSNLLIDRYLVAAEATGIPVWILMNKTDLPEAAASMEQVSIYKEIGYEVHSCSTHVENGLDQLKQMLIGKNSVFVGQSGVGKSSLVNSLLPGVEIRVNTISTNSKLGQHTTTTARLYHIEEGGEIIDSPGIRDFGIWHIEPEAVPDGYKEFGPFLGACRFRNCSHQHEPGCALLAALEAGEISAERLKNCLSLMETLRAES